MAGGIGRDEMGADAHLADGVLVNQPCANPVGAPHEGLLWRATAGTRGGQTPWKIGQQRLRGELIFDLG